MVEVELDKEKVEPDSNETMSGGLSLITVARSSSRLPNFVDENKDTW